MSSEFDRESRVEAEVELDPPVVVDDAARRTAVAEPEDLAAIDGVRQGQRAQMVLACCGVVGKPAAAGDGADLPQGLVGGLGTKGCAAERDPSQGYQPTR